MKKTLVAVLAICITFAMAFSLTGCFFRGEPAVGPSSEDESSLTEESNVQMSSEAESSEIVGTVDIPEGYKVYAYNDVSFCGPSEWEESKQDTVTLIKDNATGNNITAVNEPISTFYTSMTAYSFNLMYKPQLEAQGMAISGVTVEQVVNALGTKLTKINYTATVQGVSMQQTMFVCPKGSYNNCITVTEVVADPALVNNVFNTIS